MEAIQAMASEVLVNVALGVIALLGAYGVYFIQKAATKVKMQTTQIKDTSARKLLEDALDDVENLAVKSVGAMEQTTAKTLRDAIRFGNGNRDELLALGKQVFNEVKAAITPEAQALITKNLGSFDTYLTKCIEDAVRRVKQEDPYLAIDGELLSSGGQ